jgi:hypothetical protein
MTIGAYGSPRSHAFAGTTWEGLVFFILRRN